jgi:cytoskeleton protein RodZ
LDGSSEAGALSRPGLDFGPDIGAALKAGREALGMSIRDVAASTRIKTDFLLAIEDMRLGDLPSRPFTVGYIRTYAELVGFDADAAVERFRLEAPSADTQLRAPIGVEKESDPRLVFGIVAGVILLGLILAWNIARRTIDTDFGTSRSAAIQISLPKDTTAPGAPVQVVLQPPGAAPPEADMPEPYLTPGLAKAEAEAASAVANELGTTAVTSPAPVPVRAEPLPGTPLESGGASYGQAGSTVMLQAERSVSLIIKDPKGNVIFARQLARGDTYGVQPMPGIKAEVTDASSIKVYDAVGGYRGKLTNAQFKLNDLFSR